MTMSLKERIKCDEAVFKWVQHTPVGDLKALEIHDLDSLRLRLIREVREVGRALHWIDGIIKLKSIERDQQPSNPVVEVRS